MQLYNCLAVLYKISCLQFSYAFFCLFFSFMHSWLVSLPQSILYNVLLLKTLRVHAPETPSPYSSHQRWLEPDLTREWNKWVRWIRNLQKALTNRWFRKQGTTLANFILCYQNIFVPKNLSLNFMHIYTDDQGTFWLVFVFYFTNCYNSRMYYRNLECGDKTVWNDQNFRGNSFTRNYYQILNSAVVSVSSFCDVTNTGSFWLQGPSQLSTPLYSQLILRIYAVMNRMGGAPKVILPPGAENPRYATVRNLSH